MGRHPERRRRAECRALFLLQRLWRGPSRRGSRHPGAAGAGEGHRRQYPRHRGVRRQPRSQRPRRGDECNLRGCAARGGRDRARGPSIRAERWRASPAHRAIPRGPRMPDDSPAGHWPRPASGRRRGLARPLCRPCADRRSGPPARGRCRLDLVARMHGPTAYTRTRDLFDLDRPLWNGAAHNKE